MSGLNQLRVSWLLWPPELRPRKCCGDGICYPITLRPRPRFAWLRTQMVPFHTGYQSQLIHSGHDTGYSGRDKNTETTQCPATIQQTLGRSFPQVSHLVSAQLSSAKTHSPSHNSWDYFLSLPIGSISISIKISLAILQANPSLLWNEA